MAYEAFGKGIALGGLRDEYEIKILVCYLLNIVGPQLSMQQINEVFQQDGLVNYFDYAKAVADLKKTKHICPVNTEGDERFELTELGKSTVQTLERSLPRSVRDKVVKSAMKMMARIKREAENKVEIRKVSDGYIANLRILDIGSDLLEVNLFVPDQMQAEIIQKNFLRDPQLLYKGVIALLTGDLRAVGELMPTEENLYEDD